MSPRLHAPAAGLALASLLALAGCGGGDATVSGTPASETMAPPPSVSTPDSGAPAPSGDGGAGRYREAPATVVTTAPGYATPEVGAREKGYLMALDKAGVRTEQLADPLVAAGNTVCRIRSTGGAASETTTIADAVAGQLVAGGYSTKPVEEIARIIVDTATGKLCP